MRDRDREMLMKRLVSPSGNRMMIVPLIGWHQPSPVPPSPLSVDDAMCDYAMLDFQHWRVSITTQELAFDDVYRLYETIVLYNEALWKSVWSKNYDEDGTIRED